MGNLALTINGAPVSGREGQAILEVARENGVDIPTLCYLEDLPPVGACRLCVVEVEGSRTLVGSCHTPIAEGMVIYTHSPRVLDARRLLVELMLEQKLIKYPKQILHLLKVKLLEKLSLLKLDLLH